jgi:hypothetical protein
LLAQGSFVVDDLDRQITVLSDREEAMQQKVATLAAPERLAHQASALGMVASVNPAFLRMPDGRILGDPVVAPGTAPPPTSVTDPKEARETEAPAVGDPSGDGQGADEKANKAPADEEGAGDQKAGDQKHDGGAGHDHNNA